jgi:hypothetical protein
MTIFAMMPAIRPMPIHVNTLIPSMLHTPSLMNAA